MLLPKQGCPLWSSVEDDLYARSKRLYYCFCIAVAFGSPIWDNPITMQVVNSLVLFYSWEMVHFGGEHDVLMVMNCAWWDYKMTPFNTCTDRKWKANGEKYKTEWVTCYLGNEIFQLGFLILPDCTLVISDAIIINVLRKSNKYIREIWGLCLETKGTEYFIWSLCIVCSCYHEETSLKCSRKLSIHKSTAAMWKQAVITS